MTLKNVHATRRGRSKSAPTCLHKPLNNSCINSSSAQLTSTTKIDYSRIWGLVKNHYTKYIGIGI